MPRFFRHDPGQPPRTVTLAGLVLLAVTACAQQPPAPAAQSMPAGPAPFGAPARSGPMDAAPSASVTGRIERWLVNPNGDLDGLLLADGTQVSFPPHLSTAVLQLLKPGSTVVVTGWRAPDVAVIRASSLTAQASGRSVIDQPPMPGMRAPRDPGSLTAMSATGRVARVLHTDRGDVNGALLDDGQIVRFRPQPPGSPAPLQVGATLSARGWGTRNAQGSAFEATALGPSPDSLQELFAGPGRDPRGRREPRPLPPDAPGAAPMGAMPPGQPPLAMQPQPPVPAP